MEKERRAVEPSDMKHECYECGEAIMDGDSCTTRVVYDSPWGKPKTIYLHAGNEIRDDYRIPCEQALYDERWADFRYFECPSCKRTISRQCRTNGWHTYWREYRGRQICLSCYQNIILKKGVTRSSLREGRIEGMFFDREDLYQAGFEPVDGLHYSHIRTGSDARRYCDAALALIRRGRIVVTDYERMAVGGLEGYVSLWAKPGKGDRHEIRVSH